jgi:hypothetical protein
VAAEKKKDSKALYEVISQRKQTLGVPGWFGKPSEQGEQPDAAGESSRPEAQDVSPAVAPLPERRTKSTLEEPVVSYTGGRLRISLNQVSMVVLSMGLVLLLTVSFLVGRHSGRLAASGEVRAEVGRASGTEALKLTPVTLTPQAEQPAPVSEGRKKGLYYLVIQAGISTESQARDIQQFLRSKGIQAGIDRGPTNKWMVIDDKSFEKKDDPQIADRKNKIEQLGKEYLRKTQTYGFHQPYVRLED